MDILALISLVTSISTILTVLVVLWQTVLTRRALQFQGYLGIESLSEGTSIREGIGAINSLPTYTDYQKFSQTESPEKQLAIYDTVLFLSGIAHLVNEGYLDKYQAWSRYFFSYRLCYEKLYPWYIDGLRNTRYEGEEIAYATFEAMCVLVHDADKSEAVKNKLLKRQRKRLYLPANGHASLIYLLIRARPRTSMGILKDGKSVTESIDSRNKDVELMTTEKTSRESM